MQQAQKGGQLIFQAEIWIVNMSGAPEGTTRGQKAA
jgi:hypothetical protein